LGSVSSAPGLIWTPLIPPRWPPGGASPLEAFCRVTQRNELPLEPVLSTSAVIPKGQLAMTVVQIEKPEGVKLADWFAELRSWFDVNNCSPLLFAKARTVTNRDRFNIKFADDAQAHLFTSSFAKYGPSLRSIVREHTEVEDSIMGLTGPAVDPQLL
jgi:hypothetical protein